MAKKRLDTTLESKGAEFLVLGQLLIRKIAAYQTYTNMPGYDIIAVNPEKNTSARIQVKCRWETTPPHFLINNIDCDFVIAVKLNRGSRDGKKKVLPPQFFVFPIEFIKQVRKEGNWSKVRFKDVPNLKIYEEKWDLIIDYLGKIPE